MVSTFSGCGGSSLGYTLAGGKVRLAVEWNDNAVETYRLNFPETPIYHGDIAKLTVEEARKLSGIEPGKLDILDGSPPCQGFSTAGKRDFGDDRNQLFREYVRLLRGLQPKVFVMENVSGMVKGKMKLIFADCLRELKASGYRVKVRLLNAKYYDVPQSRQRLIFIGVREDLGSEPSHPEAQTKPKTVREAFEGLADSEDAPLLNERQRAVWLCLTPGNWNSRYATDAALRLHGSSASYRDFKPLAWNKWSCTVIKEEIGDSMIVHPNGLRGLSSAEVKRLASFPDDFVFAGSRNDAVERIGNSVPPLMMKAIAEHIRDHILKPIDQETVVTPKVASK